jgi:hypothetical protein
MGIVPVIKKHVTKNQQIAAQYHARCTYHDFIPKTKNNCGDNQAFWIKVIIKTILEKSK